jgi:hypothetical protein
MKYIIINPNELIAIIELLIKIEDLPNIINPISYNESSLPGTKSYAAK